MHYPCDGRIHERFVFQVILMRMCPGSSLVMTTTANVVTDRRSCFHVDTVELTRDGRVGLGFYESESIKA